uniref:Uncharacterized protein n=1 Tax=Rhizophora mucronata TaxID=61149 RepID=A0A2P2L7U2_RHIMU
MLVSKAIWKTTMPFICYLVNNNLERTLPAKK